MKKIKNYELRIKLFLPLFLILIALFLPAEVLSAESSPSADIKAKLEEFRKQAATKAAQLKESISKKLQNKAYIGKVQSKSDQSLTLATHSGPKIVSINQDTIYESKVKSKIKFSHKTLAEDDYVVGMGDIDETGILMAKKIILLPTQNSEPKIYLWGQIIAISDKLFTLKDKDFKNISTILPTPSVKLNDFVILTGKYNKNKIFQAEFVYVIPQGGILKPKKSLSTNSGQVATTSLKPKSSKP